MNQGRPSAPAGEIPTHLAPTFTGNRALMLEEPLIFESGSPHVTGVDLEPVPAHKSRLSGLERKAPIGLPGLSEGETVRHFTRLSRQNYGIDLGLFPLGSCTMKHNPRLNEKMARLPGFADIHPLAPQNAVQGALEARGPALLLTTSWSVPEKLPVVVASMMGIAVFFLALLSFVTSPFETLAQAPAEGRGHDDRSAAGQRPVDREQRFLDDVVGQQRHHGMMFLAVAVPDQRRQEIGHVGIRGIKVHHGVQHIGLAHTAVADGYREQFSRMQQRARHRKMLALAQRAGRCQQAGNRAGQVAEQAVLLAEAGHHVGHGLDAHLFQRGIEEHRAVETRRMVADLRHDIGMAQHHQ